VLEDVAGDDDAEALTGERRQRPREWLGDDTVEEIGGLPCRGRVRLDSREVEALCADASAELANPAAKVK
jgi:hypothetical protein